jgi:hypothetical protein
MNKEIIKAMNKKETKIDTFKKWWNKNGYKVMRVVLFPIWGCVCAKNKIENYLNSKCEWSEERAKKVLDYYIPRRARWSETDKTFYFFDNGFGWGMAYAKKYLKRKDRRWWNNHRGFSGGKIRDYLINNYEIAGFDKQVGSCYDGWTEIAFVMQQEKN